MMRTARTTNPNASRNGEAGMGLIGVMGMMVLFAVALLAVAPSVQLEVQRENELEAVRRGEEIAEAIRRYVNHHNGKLPESIDDLLEGLPQGTKKTMILRPSAATDPLSVDGRWRLIKADPNVIGAFAKRVQSFNNGLLPNNPQPTLHLDKYAIMIVNNLNTGTEDETDIVDSDFDITTDNQPFIGVASQSRNKSVIAYYGVEKHSNWIFTPLFRGTGTIVSGRRSTDLGPPPPPPPRTF